MQRIVIIGTTGSGKSTLAKRLARLHGLNYVDLDELHHLPGWRERPLEEFRGLLDEATKAERWVVAGNYVGKSADIAWTRADTLIWLDMPFFSNFIELFKRTISRIFTGEEICNGNRESFVTQFFSAESILWWFVKTWYKNTKRFEEIFSQPQQYPNLRLIRLRSYDESKQFLCDKP
jgi:adenylate kinase family enzyme